MYIQFYEARKSTPIEQKVLKRFKSANQQQKLFANKKEYHVSIML